MSKQQEITEVLQDLDAGVFIQKAARALAEAAMATVEHGEKGKTGKVTLDFTISRIGEGSQVQIAHKLAYARPTKRGKSTEEDTTSTAMYVGRGGHLSITPEVQMDFIRDDQHQEA